MVGAVRPWLDVGVGEQVDGGRQDAAAVLGRVGHEVRPAAREADPKRGPGPDEPATVPVRLSDRGRVRHRHRCFPPPEGIEVIG